VHLLPKDLRFEHEGAKLDSCTGSHLTSLRPCIHVLCVYILRLLSGIFGTRSVSLGKDRMATLLSSKHSRSSFSTQIVSFSRHLCSRHDARVDTVIMHMPKERLGVCYKQNSNIFALKKRKYLHSIAITKTDRNSNL